MLLLRSYDTIDWLHDQVRAASLRLSALFSLFLLVDQGFTPSQASSRWRQTVIARKARQRRGSGDGLVSGLHHRYARFEYPIPTQHVNGS